MGASAASNREGLNRLAFLAGFTGAGFAGALRFAAGGGSAGGEEDRFLATYGGMSSAELTVSVSHAGSMGKLSKMITKLVIFTIHAKRDRSCRMTDIMRLLPRKDLRPGDRMLLLDRDLYGKPYDE
jgi:hypothetical protein